MLSSSNLEINLSVIYENLKKLTSIFGKVMVMVKANAYGTDSVMLAKFLELCKIEDIPFIGVSHVSEGIRLRQAGISLPIFVIATFPYEAEWVAIHHLTPAVSSQFEVDQLNIAAKKHKKIISVHLQINTGLNRFGVSIDHAQALCEAIKTASHLKLDGFMTHFAAAESSIFDQFSYKQINVFKKFLDIQSSPPHWIHAANSGGAVRFHLPFCNLVRIGLGVIGYGPCAEGVQPALRFATRLASISTCAKGETVGYNCTYTMKKNGKIGVIPVGYHDGFHRILSGKGYVMIRQKRAPMIGTICMDFMMIDLSEIPEAQIGDEVVLFGPELSPEMIAEWGNTDVREILVSIPPRVKRLWVNPPLLTHALEVNLRNDDETSTERLPNAFYTFEKDSHTR